MLGESRIESVYRDYADDETRQRRYSFHDPANLQRNHSVEREIQSALHIAGLTDLRGCHILEVGCGTGYWLRECLKWGAKPEHVAGIDLLPNKIEIAKTLCPPHMRLDCGNATTLPHDSRSMDLVMTFAVFSCVLEVRMREAMAGEIRRVLKPGGHLLWYDLIINNPWNPHVIGISKRQLLSLFPGCSMRLKRITFAPPLARLLAPYSTGLCSAIETLRIFNTSYLGIIQT